MRTICGAVARMCSSALSTSLCANASTPDSAAAASALTSIVVSAAACGRCAGNIALTPSLRFRASCAAVSHLMVSHNALRNFSKVSALIYYYTKSLYRVLMRMCASCARVLHATRSLVSLSRLAPAGSGALEAVPGLGFFCVDAGSILSATSAGT